MLSTPFLKISVRSLSAWDSKEPLLEALKGCTALIFFLFCSKDMNAFGLAYLVVVRHRNPSGGGGAGTGSAGIYAALYLLP